MKNVVGGIGRLADQEILLHVQNAPAKWKKRRHK